MTSPKLLIEWAEKIDNRLGPISGRDADTLAMLLRKTADDIAQFIADRDDQDRAIRDALGEIAPISDELAFWKYQAIYGRAFMLDAQIIRRPLPEESPVWKDAERQLEAARVEENRERYAHAEAPRDPVGT